MFFLKIIILSALIRLLIAIRRPFLCSGLYAASVVFLALFGDINVLGLLIGGAIVLAVSSLYFWALNHFMDNNAIFWTILVVGIAFSFL